MKSIYTLMLLIFALTVNATEGHDRGGGGDPRAVKFLGYGKTVATSLLAPNNSETLKSLSIQPVALMSEVNRLYVSLDGKSPKLRFHESNFISCFGVEKKGCRQSDGSVDVAGTYWEAPETTEQDRCTLALTELLRGQKTQHIYEKVDLLCELIGTSAKMSGPVSEDFTIQVAGYKAALDAGRKSCGYKSIAPNQGGKHYDSTETHLRTHNDDVGVAIGKTRAEKECKMASTVFTVMKDAKPWTCVITDTYGYTLSYGFGQTAQEAAADTLLYCSKINQSEKTAKACTEMIYGPVCFHR